MMQIIYKPPNLNCLCSRTANDALKLPNLECSTVYFVVVGESGPRSDNDAHPSHFTATTHTHFQQKTLQLTIAQSYNITQNTAN